MYDKILFLHEYLSQTVLVSILREAAWFLDIKILSFLYYKALFNYVIVVDLVKL